MNYSVINPRHLVQPVTGRKNKICFFVMGVIRMYEQCHLFSD